MNNLSSIFIVFAIVYTFFMPSMTWASTQNATVSSDVPVRTIENLPLADVDLGIPKFSYFDVSHLTSWYIGFWWITETHEFKDYKTIRTGHEILGDIVLYHKWIVEEKTYIDEEECWIINIYPYELPESVVNDHGNEFLYSLAIRTSDFTLKKIMSNTRYGDYCVSGQTPERHEFVYENANPVMTDWLLLPVDVPKFPNRNDLYRDNRATTYKDERTGDEIVQTNVRFNDGPKDVDSPAMYITLLFRNTLKTQYWVAEYPWWAEVRIAKTDGMVSRVRYSKTIDWKDKQ